jgi:hypothetical protein
MRRYVTSFASSGGFRSFFLFFLFFLLQNLDYARMQACVEAFSPFFAPGGWMALSAGYYHFAKEIPMLTDYEIHVSIGGFEDKWVSRSCRS